MKIWLYKKSILGNYVAREYQEIPSNDFEALEMWKKYDGGKSIPREKVSAQYWRELIDSIRFNDGWERIPGKRYRQIAAPFVVADPAKLKQRLDDNTVQRFPPGLIKYLHFGY